MWNCIWSFHTSLSKMKHKAKVRRVEVEVLLQQEKKIMHPTGSERHSCAAVCLCSTFRCSNRLDLTCYIPHRKVNISILQAQDVYLEGLKGRRRSSSASNFRPMWPEKHFIRSWESKQGFAGWRRAGCLFWIQQGYFCSRNKWDVKPGQCATVTCFHFSLIKKK